MYLGRNPVVGAQKMLDSLESQFNGTLTTFDLRYGGVPTYPTLSASLIVSLGGVLQEPGVAYYVSSDSIVFSEAPLAGTECWILLYSEYGASQTGTHSALNLLNADDHLQYIHTTNTRTGVTAEFNTTGKITTTGNVGAGTTNPLHKLDVSGDICFNNNSLISNYGASSNIDHIWHDDSTEYGAPGAWHFVSDSGNKSTGNSVIRAGAFANMGDTGTSGQELQITGGAYVSGNVGIGITNPSEKLDVVGNIKLTGELRGPASFVIDPAAVGDNTGTVVIKGDLRVDGTTTTINSTTLTVDDKNITIADGASTLANIDTAGIDFGSTAVRVRYNYNAGTNSGLSIEGANVGIGITAPLTKLHVVSADPEVLLVERSGDANALIQYKNTDGAMYAGLTPNATGWGVDDDNNVGSGPMFFVSRTTGNVGIATNSPVTSLHVSDGTSGVISTALYTSDYVTISAQATAPGFNIISANNSSASGRGVFKATRSRGTLDTPLVPLANDDVFSLLGAVYDSSAAALATAAINLNVDGTVSAGVAPQRISFWTGTTNTRLERMRITSAGNVGIGTTSPSGILNLDRADLSTDTWLRVSQAGTEVFSLSQPSTSEIRFATPDLGVDREFTFYTRGLERARIDSSGRLLVGTPTSRQSRLGASAYQTQFQLESNDTQTGLATSRFNDASGSSFVNLQKGRGTIASPAAVIANDVTGTIVFSGWDGAAFTNSAIIRSEVDGTPGADDMPGRLTFFTTADGAAGSTERMRITSAGLVGIGTSSPGQRLEVGGTGATIRINDTSSGANVYGELSNPGDTTSSALVFTARGGAASLGGFSFNSTDGTSTNTYLTIDNTGKVGIGTTSPERALHVYGTTSSIATLETGQSASNIRYINSTGNSVYAGSIDGNNFYWNIAGSERARIDSSGRVGIGTSSPLSYLNVVGTGTTAVDFTATDAQASANTSLLVHNNTNNNDAFSQLILRQRTSNQSDIRLTAWNGDNPYFTIAAQRRLSGQEYAKPLLTIGATSGNVGIGTSSPSSRLHVVSNVQFDPADSNATAGLIIQNSGGTVGSGAYSTALVLSQVNSGRPGAAIASVQTSADPDQLGLAFCTHGAASSSDVTIERLRIDAAGNVGIGTTNPATKLDVNGAAKIGPTLTSRSGSGLTIGFTNNITFALNTDADDSVRLLSIVNESTTTNAMSVLGFRVNPDTPTANAQMDMKFVGRGATNQSALHYSFNDSGSWKDRFTILSGGQVGIGTTTPNTGYLMNLHGISTSPDSGIYLNLDGWVNNATEYGINIDIDSTATDALTANRVQYGILNQTNVRVPSNASTTDTRRYSLNGAYNNMTVDDNPDINYVAGKVYDLYGSNNRARFDATGGASSVRGAYNLVQAGTHARILATTAASGTGTVVTLTFAATTSPVFPVGSTILVETIVPTAYRGTFTVTACTTTTVSYNHTATGAQTTAGTVELLSIVDAAYGTYSHVVNSSANHRFTNAYGSYNYINPDVAGGEILNAFGSYSRLDRDAGIGGTGYLFYGTYEGTWTTKYGLHINGETTNYLSGNVGIGTTNPSYKLHVVGDVNFTGTLNQNGVPLSSASVDIQEFTTSGTWTKPSGAKMVYVEVIGGGGGGGSGRKQAAPSTSDTFGAGGGAGGMSLRRWILASNLGSTVTVTVGAGGAGGAAVTTATTNGNSGVAGGNSSFGTLLIAAGGALGGLSTLFGAAGGEGKALSSNAVANTYLGAAGGGSGVSGAASYGNSGYYGWEGPGGGGAGGGLRGSDGFQRGGGEGGGGFVAYDNSQWNNSAFGGGGGTAGLVGNAGGAGVFGTGDGGGGGGSGNTVSGGNGGAGGFPGGGGGGGGTTNTGASSGAGGAGAGGFVRVYTYF